MLLHTPGCRGESKQLVLGDCVKLLVTDAEIVSFACPDQQIHFGYRQPLHRNIANEIADPGRHQQDCGD